MASSLFIWEAGTIFVGSGGGDADKGLIVNNIKISDLDELTQDFHPGGSYGAIEIGGLGNKAFNLSFKVKGIDPQSMSQFGVNGVAQNFYSIYGGVRNKNGNIPVEYKAIIQARMVKVGNDEYKRGDLVGQDFELKEVTHMEIYFNQAEKYFWDFFGRIWRVDGVNQNDMNAILRVAG
jgi:hypothetical protein